MEIAKQMMSRVLLVAAAAIAVAVAIIAVLPAAPASAQSEESAGRIVAQRLEDGRVEFGWQPTGGSRVLPRQRYFPADITHNRWLRSSPVEVDGAAIGRINARQLSDGRIEFAFTPTDGERITPQARYFPTSARENRWLRSTEITIGPAPPRYIAVSAGDSHTCAIRDTGAIECWGYNGDGQADAPEGRFTAVSASAHRNYTCAIRESGEIACWGMNKWGQADAPEGSYTAISTGSAHTCAIRASDSAIECWGDNQAGQTDAPEGSYTAISTGSGHNCGLRENGELECWGSDPANGAMGVTDAPDGQFRFVSAGANYTCAIRENGEIKCWGWFDYRQADAMAGKFRAVSAGFEHICGLRENGEIECWADHYDAPAGREADTPAGSYSAVSVGYGHTCAIRESDSAIECWGDNDLGQATPPTN